MNNRFDFAAFSRLFLDFSLVLLDRSRFKDALRCGFVGLVSDKLVFFFFFFFQLRRFYAIWALNFGII